MIKRRKKFGKPTRLFLLIISITVILISILAIHYFNDDLFNPSPILDKNLFSYASPESQGISNESVDKLISTIQDFLDKELIVGAELVVIKNRKIVLHETVGWNDKENNISMEKNTLFNVRSMTKPITGAAIQVLIDDGYLRLDDKIAEYLPGFVNNQSQNITIEQLLTHRSGLPLSVISSTDEYDTLLSLANAVGTIGPEFEPGSKFWYSDAGTEVLGAVIEMVTNSSLDVFVTESILKPLGMNSSYYYHLGTYNNSLRDKIAALYLGEPGGWVKGWSNEEPLYPFAFGSQGIYCTALDYARFLLMWMDEGMCGETQVLSKAAVARTLTPVSVMSSLGSDMPYPTGFRNLSVYYGQMVNIFSNESLPNIVNIEVIGHSGSDGTYAWAWPAEDLIVIYCTQSRGSTSGLKLEPIIDEQLVHHELKQINEQARELYSDFLGSYTADFGPFRNTEFIVCVQNGHLAVDIPSQIVFELMEPDESNMWYAYDDYGFAVSFDDEKGNITGMKFYQGENVFELSKGVPLDNYVEVYPDDMGKYVGLYQTEDPNIVVSVMINEGRLSLNITGQPMLLDLFPPDDNGIWLMRLNPSVGIFFNESADGSISSFLAYLPDGTTLIRNRID